MELHKHLFSRGDTEEEEDMNAFVEVMKRTMFDRTRGVQYEVEGMCHYRSPVALEEASIDLYNSQIEGGLSEITASGDFNVISVSDQFQDVDAQEEVNVFIEGSSKDYLKRGSNFDPEECNFFSNDFPFSNYVALAGSSAGFNEERENCVRSLITHLNLVLMLLALLVPLSLHMFCEFKLYNHLVGVTPIVNPAEAKAEEYGILHHLTEFENFFLLGVMIYVLVQFIGFFITHSRYQLYLRHLCLLVIDEAREALVTKCKSNAMERLADYTKNMGVDPNVLKITRRNMMRSFDEASQMFNDSKLEYIWNKLGMLRIRTFLVKIWIPFGVNTVLSFLVSLYFYYKKIGLDYRVPLGHPKIISNMYWNVAFQYEGFWWILGVFALNVLTWLYLCSINRHGHFYKVLDEALSSIREIIEEFKGQVSRNIWEREMFYIVRNVGASESGSDDTFPEYQKFPSEIKIRGEGAPCLCKYLCTVSDEEYIDMGSKFEDLSVVLLRGGKSLWRKF